MFNKIFSITALMALSVAAYAWDGSVNGTITEIDFTGGATPTSNQDIRVYMGATYLCPGSTYSWGYINVNDPNYQVLSAALMMAKATGSRVSIYSLKDSNNYCHIGYIQVV